MPPSNRTSAQTLRTDDGREFTGNYVNDMLANAMKGNGPTVYGGHVQNRVSNPNVNNTLENFNFESVNRGQSQRVVRSVNRPSNMGANQGQTMAPHSRAQAGAVRFSDVNSSTGAAYWDKLSQPSTQRPSNDTDDFVQSIVDRAPGSGYTNSYDQQQQQQKSNFRIPSGVPQPRRTDATVMRGSQYTSNNSGGGMGSAQQAGALQQMRGLQDSDVVWRPDEYSRNGSGSVGPRGFENALYPTRAPTGVSMMNDSSGAQPGYGHNYGPPDRGVIGRQQNSRMDMSGGQPPMGRFTMNSAGQMTAQSHPMSRAPTNDPVYNQQVADIQRKSMMADMSDGLQTRPQSMMGGGNMQMNNNGMGGGYQTRPSGPHPPRRSYQSAFQAPMPVGGRQGTSVSRSPSPLQQTDVVRGYDMDQAEDEREWRKEKTERRVRKKLKKMLTMFNDELPSDKLAVEELKEAGMYLYMEQDYESAIDFFTKAILLFESRFYENCPRDFHSKKVLSILYGNRCQCYLMCAKMAQGGIPFDPQNVNPEVRYWALRANRDAVMGYTLDPTNAKAFHRRGQALLLLSSMQQRSKEAVKNFERALLCNTLPEPTKAEAVQWLHYAKQRADDETPLPLITDDEDGEGGGFSGCAIQ